MRPYPAEEYRPEEENAHLAALVEQSDRAVALARAGAFAESEELQRSVLEARERILGADHEETLACVNNLAFVLERLGRNKEAEDLHRRALGGKEKTLGHSHPSTIASLHQLAGLLKRSGGRENEAEEVYRRALECGLRAFGQDHLDVLLAAASLAVLLATRGADREAGPLCKQAKEGFGRTLGPEHSLTKACSVRLAAIEQRLGGAAF